MKRTAFRIATAMIAIGATSVALAGCGQKVGGDAAAAAKDDVLVYRSIWSAEEPQAKILQDALDEFAEAEGVKVDVEFLGRTGGDALTTQMAAGKGPDIFDAGSDNLPAWRAQNLALGIDDVLDMEVPGEGKKVKDVIPESVRSAASDEDGLGFLPHTAISTAVWFDAAAHPELAENPPQTWDEFIGYLDSAKSDGRVPICQDGTVPFYNVYWLSSALVNADGAGSLLALQKDADAWDGKGVRQAVERVAELAAGDYFQPNFMATKYPAAQDSWIQGGCDLNINGTWLASEVSAATPEGAKISSFQLPVGGEKSVEVGALGLGVNAKGKHPELGKKFLAFFAQEKFQERIASEAKNIPARADVAAPDALQTVQTSIADAENVHLTYDTAAGVKTWWNDQFLPLSDELLSGKISADDFLSQGKEKTAQFLAAQ